ncbi:hypothetical protein B0O99DRAFT_605480 [Bisporella sp. PMI_857]|nr:hypothetical protein B0O99DRAFT_605480 [Bisporella sp. PMI_857]
MARWVPSIPQRLLAICRFLLILHIYGINFLIPIPRMRLAFIAVSVASAAPIYPPDAPAAGSQNSFFRACILKVPRRMGFFRLFEAASGLLGLFFSGS